MKVKSNVSYATWPAVVLGLTLLVSPALFAQEPAENPEKPAEEQQPAETTTEEPQSFAGDVVVTAQKREQKLQEVPMSVQAFESAALEEANIRDLNEVITLVPGASEEMSNSIGLRRYQIRGLTQGVGDSTVGYYLDDSAFFFWGQQFAPMGRTFDVEQVEVLRGPQSTLYGNGSMGGTIRYLTNAPNLSNFEAHLRAAYSGTDGGDPGGYFDAAVSVPLVKNKLALRLVGSYQDIGGYHVMPSEGLENTNPADAQNMRASLLWAPTDKLTLQFLYARNTADQDGNALLAATDPPVATYLPGDFLNTDFDLYYATLTYGFAKATLSSTTTYIDYGSMGRASAPFPVPGGTLSVDFAEDSNALNNETRLVSNSDKPLQWILGAFYSDTDFSRSYTYDPAIVLPISDNLKSESISVFGEVSWAFLDGKLIPLVGLRYFTDDRTAVLGSATVQPEPATFDSVNPRFNLSYLPTGNSTYYLNIAKGFRSGNFNVPDLCQLHSALGGLPCEVELDSDQLWSYEIGTKQTLAGGQVLLDAALYYQDWIDMRQPVPFYGFFQEYQIGDALIPGIDVQLVYTPAAAPGLTLRANGNWNDAHIASIDPALSGASGAEKGDRLPFVPEWTASLAATYNWTITPTWMGQASLSFSHIEPQLGQFGTPAEGDSRDLLRARFGFQNGRYGIYLFGNNLLNENGAIYSQTPVGGISQFTQDYPRQIGLEITYDFW